jgi:hypothetical protein
VVILHGTGQIPPGAHVVQLTVHCRLHPGPILYGRRYDGINCLSLGPVESQEYVGNYAPTDDERRQFAAEGIGQGNFPIAKPKPGQPEHWHFLASCTRCSYHVSLGARDSQIVEFVKGLWVRRAPSLIFYNVGPFLEGLGRIGADGWLRVIDDLGGVGGFEEAMNRNWNPDSAGPPICRIA